MAIENEGSVEEIISLLNTGSALYHRYAWNELAIAINIQREDVVSLLLDRAANINTVDDEYGTVLAAAADSGDPRIVLLLLHRGADINAVGRESGNGTALTVAALAGCMDIVSLLLGQEANINIVGGKYGTPLIAAAFNGSIDIVLLLLDRGAHINVVSGDYGTALIAAAFRGSMDIVWLLLSRDADINVVGGKYGTALAAAALGESVDIISLLLDGGADINMVGGEYGTALAAAAFKGNAYIVSLLLNRGANINAVSGDYGTALTAAAVAGKTDIVTLLLDRGAYIHVVGGDYGTALVAAAFKGNVDIIWLLLSRGVDINAVGYKYGTALAAAALAGSMNVISLLLEQGANVNVIGGGYGTALVAAAFRGSMEIMWQLLPQGADTNAVGGNYGTALAAAALGARMEIVLLLLDRGADINQVGGTYGTALVAAAFSGSADIVSLLLARGANITIVAGDYGTALVAAAFRGSIDIVWLLLSQGVDINYINQVAGMYGTALAAAVFGGNTDIVSLLLERGADVMHVGGSYSTTSGVYPSALDVAHSEGSRASPTLLALLESAANKNRNGPGDQQTNTTVDPADNVTSRPPFPMPYTGPSSGLCAGYDKDALPSTLSSLPTLFKAGSNITPDEADVPCRKINEEVLWKSLAALVGIHEYSVQDKYQWIQNDIRYFVSCNLDFGLAYAAARIAWRHFNIHSVDSNVISIQRSWWLKQIQLLDGARWNAIEIYHSSSEIQLELIRSPYSIMPRRLWDLKSNRLVDFQILHAVLSTTPAFWAVTHSWTNDMSPFWTAVNQHQWPIPIPKDISLDNLRSELLTLGAEYVWLDVVCLRQESKSDYHEWLRQKEWKLDVPTIGNIYRAAAKIVRYFNGLGVSFSNDGWEDPRHWLQRAWTLQEIKTENTTINGGILQDKGQVLMNSQGKVSGQVVKLRDAIRPVIQLATQVDSPLGCELYELAREMAKRHASQSVDKISGLFYLLRTTKLACYNENMSSEDFWRQCFHLLPAERKAEILFDFPYRGSDEQWFPTWVQVLDWPARDPAYQHMRFEGLRGQIMCITGEMSFVVSNLRIIPHAVLKETDNPGEYEVKIGNRLFGFYLPYLLQEPIDIQDQAEFALVITADVGHAHNWVVCKAMGTRIGADVGVAELNILKKVGVIRTDDCGKLLAGGGNGVPLLQQMDCLFV